MSISLIGLKIENQILKKKNLVKLIPSPRASHTHDR